MKNTFYWHRLFLNWRKDSKVVIFIVGLLMIFRIIMLIVFHDQRGPDLTSSDYLLFFFRSLRFDLRIALLMVLPTVFLGFLIFNEAWERKLDFLRATIGRIMIVVTLWLCAGNLGFFWEYHDQYNQWIYGLFHDDLKAIMLTVWKTYPVIWIAIGIVVMSILCLKLFSLWLSKVKILDMKNSKLSLGWGWKLLMVLIITSLYIVGLRGSMMSRPLQRDDIGVTRDHFLNKLVANPYFSLYYTHSDHKHLNRAVGIEVFLKNQSIEDALMLLYPYRNNESKKIDDWIKKKINTNGVKIKPKHIFLIILESQDNWPMMEKFEWLDLAPNLKKLASQGLYVKSFVSAGCNTQASLSAIITGLPDANVFTNFQSSSQSQYTTAFAKPFKDLGYQVNLFYGGHLAWQRLGELAINQGFDHVYGQEHMPLTSKSHSWGVFDEELFDYVLKTVDSNVPSVNLIMTTTNHSPYPVNLKAKGCPQIVCPKKYRDLENSFTKPQIIGHLWYNDYCIGGFVKEAEKLFDPALFAITGDHTSRRFFSSRPSLYESKSVPLILYGTSKMFGEIEVPERMAGSHLDILPTIIESIAPKGFEYYALGKNLFDFNGQQMGLGAGVVITPDVICPIDRMHDFEELPWNKEDLGKIDVEHLGNLYNAFHGVGWWKIMKGSEVGGVTTSVSDP